MDKYRSYETIKDKDIVELSDKLRKASYDDIKIFLRNKIKDKGEKVNGYYENFISLIEEEYLEETLAVRKDMLDKIKTLLDEIKAKYSTFDKYSKDEEAVKAMESEVWRLRSEVAELERLRKELTKPVEEKYNITDNRAIEAVNLFRCIKNISKDTDGEKYASYITYAWLMGKDVSNMDGNMNKEAISSDELKIMEEKIENENQRFENLAELDLKEGLWK